MLMKKKVSSLLFRPLCFEESTAPLEEVRTDTSPLGCHTDQGGLSLNLSEAKPHGQAKTLLPLPCPKSEPQVKIKGVKKRCIIKSRQINWGDGWKALCRIQVPSMSQASGTMGCCLPGHLAASQRPVCLGCQQGVRNQVLGWEIHQRSTEC